MRIRIKSNSLSMLNVLQVKSFTIFGTHKKILRFFSKFETNFLEDEAEIFLLITHSSSEATMKNSSL